MLEKFKNNENLGLLLDIGHLNISSKYFDFDLEETIRNLTNNHKSKIFEIHLSRNDGNRDKHNIIPKHGREVEMMKKFDLQNKPIVIEADMPLNELTQLSNIL
jgi:sugar phosphate isomerase/epimerase